jgi:tRNA-dihydrouridine synthase
LPEPDLAERLRYALEHTQKMIEYKGEGVAVREMRGQLPWYVKGFKGASAFRGRLTSVNSLDEIHALFTEIQCLG